MSREIESQTSLSYLDFPIIFYRTIVVTPIFIFIFIFLEHTRIPVGVVKIVIFTFQMGCAETRLRLVFG